MFKKALFIFVITILFLSISMTSQAEEKESSNSTKTVAPSPTENTKVKTIKDKLATKVAEIRQNQKRGFLGTIDSISATSFTLVTRTGEIKVRYNEDTKIFKLTNKKLSEAQSEDLKNKLSVSVLGLFDEETKQHQAKVIVFESKTNFFMGTITKINKTDSAITIKNGKEETTVDYETSTQAFEFTSDDTKLVKSGLSKLAEGDFLNVWTRPSDDSESESLIKVIKIPRDVLGAKTEEKTSEASKSASPKTASKSAAKASPKNE